MEDDAGGGGVYAFGGGFIALEALAYRAGALVAALVLIAGGAVGGRGVEGDADGVAAFVGCLVVVFGLGVLCGRQINVFTNQS